MSAHHLAAPDDFLQRLRVGRQGLVGGRRRAGGTQVPVRRRRRGLRLGLRGRVTVSFGLVALILSMLLSVAVWLLVPRFLLAQRESATLQRAVANAQAVQRGLAAGGTAVPALLGSLPASAGTVSLLSYDGAWYASTPATSRDILPGELRETVASGTPARQRVEVAGKLALAVGLPISPDGDGYFEVFPLEDLDQTNRVLGVSLAATAAVVAGLGLAVGHLASRRALRPLTEITQAAGAIARFDLDARLRLADDPDLARLAESFNAKAAALQHRVVADLRFAGDVSHELRTPLTTMVNSVQVMQNRREVLPADAREALELLAEEVSRFQRMVDDLLEISRADSGDGGGWRESVAVAELVRHAADAAAARPVTVIEPGAGDLSLKVDKRRLERVVANLVQNADTHGGGCLQVKVVRAGKAVRFLVDDAGPGVAAPQRERVFERFARGADPTEGRSVGLGLAIVARHVQHHGGTVWVEDRPGGGARFVVELPVRAP